MVAAKRRAKQTWADLENADTPAAADTSGAVLGSWWWQQRWHGPQFAHLVQRAQFCHANIFADDLGGELVCCDARRWRLHTGRRAAAAWLDTAEAYVRIPQCPAPVPGGPRRGADTRGHGSHGDTWHVAVWGTV